MSDPTKKILHAAVTEECIRRLREGNVEQFDMGDSILEIRYLKEEPAKGSVGIRGRGTYIFEESESPR